MPKISFEDWCIINNLDPNSNSSKKVYSQFKKAFATQTFIKKILERKQANAVEVSL